jgi:hypothetical protein
VIHVRIGLGRRLALIVFLGFAAFEDLDEIVIVMGVADQDIIRLDERPAKDRNGMRVEDDLEPLDGFELKVRLPEPAELECRLVLFGLLRLSVLPLGSRSHLQKRDHTETNEHRLPNNAAKHDELHGKSRG